jgi:hypothetical protein
MNLSLTAKVLALSAGFALSSGFIFPHATNAQIPKPALTATWLLLQGQKYPIIRSMPVILNKAGGLGSVGDIIRPQTSDDGRYELVELIGDMSSQSVFSYMGRTAFRKARVQDTVTGEVLEVLLPLIVRYF